MDKHFIECLREYSQRVQFCTHTTCHVKLLEKFSMLSCHNNIVQYVLEKVGDLLNSQKCMC